MLRHLTCLIVACLAFLLTACASTGPDPNYAAYVAFVESQQAARQARYASLAAAADKCTADACVEHVAALAAVAVAAGAGEGVQLQPYQRQPSTAERIGLALVGQLGPLAGAAVAWHQSDTSRDIALGQYDFLGGVIRDVATSPALAAPSITVGGDYVTGRVGDTVGGDQVGGNQHHGDAVGGDQIGGDRIDNSGNFGDDNRQGSPGPIQGDTCTGDTCQGQPPPEPVLPDPGNDG